MGYDNWKAGDYDSDSPVNAESFSDSPTIEEILDGLSKENKEIVENHIYKLECQIKKLKQLLDEKKGS